MKTFINPFEKYSELQLIITGILFALLGGYLATIFNGRFDGAIDLHFVKKVSFSQPFLDILIAIVVLTILLYAAGKYINKKTRFVDILTTCLIAKIPFYFLVFFNINNTLYAMTEKLMSNLQNGGSLNLEFADLSSVIAFSIITLIFLVWTVMLLYNGFKTATNSKGIKHNMLFITALLVGEILSKILISTLN